MLERVFKSRRVIQQYRQGPLRDHIDEFLAVRVRQGYPRRDLNRRLGPISDFNRWLINRRYTLGDLCESAIAEFVAYRTERIPGSVRYGNIALLNQLIDFLRCKGCVPQGKPPAPKNGSIELVVQSYSTYLDDEKGLAPVSVNRYARCARDLLLDVFRDRPIELASLTQDAVVGFLIRRADQCSSKHTQGIASTLRSFLRFLQVNGYVRDDIARCIPKIPAWRAAHLPEFLTRKEVRMLLGTCKRRSHKGRRDYAILLLLVRLGLRASEVLHLSLDDIDWREGEITIRGKGNQRVTLPLPRDVGEAIVAYVRRSRPRCSCRSLFVRTRAPHRGLRHPGTISTIVRRAILAAGLNPRSKGAHLLRYTMATECLRHGATLSQIGDLLGHRSSATTALYAKVDVVRLSELALEWPATTETKEPQG